MLKDTPPTDAELGKFPILKAYNTADYPNIVRLLLKAGIASIWMEKPTCINGLFAAKKDDLHDRFMLDGGELACTSMPPPRSACPTWRTLPGFFSSRTLGCTPQRRTCLTSST